MKNIFSFSAYLISFIPFWDNLVIYFCKVGDYDKKKTFVGRLIYQLFCKEYYRRPFHRRVEIQSKLGDGEAGANWANYYFKEGKKINYPPKIGIEKQGDLEWHEANPALNRTIDLISEDPSNFCVIQVGASSGKVISYLAEKFPKTDCIYSDIFHSVTSFAKKKFKLPNLKFVTCPSECVAAIAQTSIRKRILIISIGSCQYVQPENINKTFQLISSITGKEINFIFDEPGRKYQKGINQIKGSIPRGKLSYTHNYKYYAEKYKFNIKSWDIIEPYRSIKDYPIHFYTLHLSGWFSILKNDL